MKSFITQENESHLNLVIKIATKLCNVFFKSS